jgi:hypothetical protein
MIAAIPPTTAKVVTIISGGARRGNPKTILRTHPERVGGCRAGMEARRAGSTGGSTMRGGRPGLIGTVARTAVVAGTATVTTRAVDKKMQEREMKKVAQGQQAAPPAPAPPGITREEKMAQLRELAELKQMGGLTEEEFQQEKQKILAR